MTGLSFKSALFSLVIVCFLSGSALADTFTFTTGDAGLNANDMDFMLSGPSFFIHSGFINGPDPIVVCAPGPTCTIPLQDIPANNFQPLFSGGTVGGVTADTLVGSLTFSSFSFTAEPDVDNNGPVTVTGDITGCVDAIGTCNTDVGSQVFHLQISGSGTGTASGVLLTDGTDVIHGVEYTISGTADTVPEPLSVLLLSSGLIGFAAIRRWHLLRRVNH